jgi:hypothetical protein
MNSPLQDTVGVEEERVPDDGVAAWTETAVAESSRQAQSSGRSVENRTKVLWVTPAR